MSVSEEPEKEESEKVNEDSVDKQSIKLEPTKKDGKVKISLSLFRKDQVTDSVEPSPSVELPKTSVINPEVPKKFSLTKTITPALP
jgi:hypothetical protein